MKRIVFHVGRTIVEGTCVEGSYKVSVPTQELLWPLAAMRQNAAPTIHAYVLGFLKGDYDIPGAIVLKKLTKINIDESI